MIGKPMVGSVVGPTTLSHWGQVLHLPGAYGVVEVSYPDGGARAAGIHLLSELHARLTEPPTSLKELTGIVESAAGEGVETILLCIPVSNVLYLALSGKGDVYIRRGKEFARLLRNSGSVSGEIKPGDTIILASCEFSRALTLEEAGAVFDHLTPEEVAERLTLILHEKPYGEGSAAMVLQFGESADTDEVRETPTQSEEVSKLTRAKVFLAHFHPRRVRRHLSIPVIKNDIQRLRAHPKRMTFMVTAVLIALFGIAVIMGIWKQATQGASPAIAASISDAKHALEEGVALMDLNPVKGRERLQTAKDLLIPLSTSVSSKSPVGREISGLLARVDDNLTQSMQITKAKPELFFDASLVKKGASIASIGFEETTICIIDSATQTVIALDVTSKKATVVGGGAAYAGMSYCTIHGDSLYVFTGSGVHKAVLGEKETRQSVVKKDPQWGNIASLTTFGGNVYLLDITKSRIWKYVATETGFTDTREYLNPDTLPDLTQTNSLAIDGSVWLGSVGGRIWKFTGGKEDTFIPKGVAPGLGKTLVMYTSDAVNNLYVLDADNKRVVVMEKDGTYLAQYVWEDALTPTQLAVSEATKKIYLLAGGKLYTVPLK